MPDTMSEPTYSAYTKVIIDLIHRRAAVWHRLTELAQQQQPDSAGWSRELEDASREYGLLTVVVDAIDAIMEQSDVDLVSPDESKTSIPIPDDPDDYPVR